MQNSTLMKTDDSNHKQPQLLAQQEKYKILIFEFETPIKWINALLITAWHVIAVWTLITYPFWHHWGLSFYILFMASIGAFGVTAGAHRYWAHRSYKATLPLRLILLFSFTLAAQNSIQTWVRDHRIHHKFSETDADPHNPKRGFFFSHVGWLMMRRHPEVVRKGQTIDTSDLFEDPLVAFHQKYFTYFLVLGFIVPTLIPVYFMGETLFLSILAVCFVRYLLNLHYTWLVNSVAHVWGQRPYDKRISPADNPIVSLIALGEGYHNYHHTFPWDYRTSEVGRKLNITTLLINIFKSIGWAYDLKTPSLELVKKYVVTHGDGSHTMWGHEVPVEKNSWFTSRGNGTKNLKSHS